MDGTPTPEQRGARAQRQQCSRLHACPPHSTAARRSRPRMGPARVLTKPLLQSYVVMICRIYCRKTNFSASTTNPYILLRQTGSKSGCKGVRQLCFIIIVQRYEAVFMSNLSPAPVIQSRPLTAMVAALALAQERSRVLLKEAQENFHRFCFKGPQQ